MLIDNSDHVAPKTGIAEANVTVKTSKDGGALTDFTLTGLWTELGQGLYTIDFAIGDLDTVGFFAYLVTSAGCDQYAGMMYVDDFSDYMADVSLLALEATAQDIVERTDRLPDDPADHSGLIVAMGAVGGSLQIVVNDAHGVTDGKLDTAQADLDNPDQYKADVTALALEASLTTAQTALTYLKQKESGRWKIENNQLTYYDDLGGILKRFNLFNKQGQASNENPYERVPTD